MVMKKSGRGSVTRAFRQNKRFQEDKKFREKGLERGRIYYMNNREKIRKRHKNWCEELDKFANKRCKECNILLNYMNISGFCRKHIWEGRRKK